MDDLIIQIQIILNHKKIKEHKNKKVQIKEVKRLKN